MSTPRRRPVLASFLFLNSLAVFVIWPALLSNGAFPKGLTAYQMEGTIPILHLVSEFLMALITIAGATAMWLGDKRAEKITLLGLGMFLYSAINSLGWKLHNQFLMALPMIVTLILAAVAIPPLLLGDDPDDQDEESLRHAH